MLLKNKLAFSFFFILIIFCVYQNNEHFFFNNMIQSTQLYNQDTIINGNFFPKGIFPKESQKYLIPKIEPVHI